HRCECRARPECHPEQQEIKTRWRAVGFLTDRELAEQILSHGFGKETVAAAQYNGDEPGQYQRRHPYNAWKRPQRENPAPRAVEYRERSRRQDNEDNNQWPLEQHARGQRSP